MSQKLSAFSVQQEIQLRFLSPSDIPDIKQLCADWFPIEWVSEFITVKLSAEGCWQDWQELVGTKSGGLSSDISLPESSIWYRGKHSINLLGLTDACCQGMDFVPKKTFASIQKFWRGIHI